MAVDKAKASAALFAFDDEPDFPAVIFDVNR